MIPLWYDPKKLKSEISPRGSYFYQRRTGSAEKTLYKQSTAEKWLCGESGWSAALMIWKLLLVIIMHIRKWYFSSANGNYRDRSSVFTSLKRFTKGTEFEHMTLHKLRHCNATMLLNMGVDLKIISDHLWHCDINVTADIYADVLSSTRKVLADSIEKKLTE